MSSQEENKEVCHNDKKEADKMRKRLTEAALYEPGMTLQNMREILNVLDESAMMHENSKSQSSDSLCAEEPSTVSKSPTENNNEMKMNYANVVKTTSTENDISTEKKDEEESIIDSKSQNISKDNMLKEKALRRRKKMFMNPFMERNEDDMELNQRNGPIIKDREPSFLWSNFDYPSNDLIQEMSDYLQKLRDEWMAEALLVADDSILQWGSPIEVSSRNSNLEKKVVTRNEAEPSRERLYRASKRKASSLIENINNVSDSEPEADDDSAFMKKRKHQQEKREPIASGSKVHVVVDVEVEPAQTSNTSHLSSTNNKLFDDSEDEDIFEPVTKTKAPEDIYPRRISPPNPYINKSRRGKSRGGKTNFKGPRSKKSSENKLDELGATSLKTSAQEIVLDGENDELHDISPKTDPKMLRLTLPEKTKLAKKKLEDIQKKENDKLEEKKLQEIKIEEEKQRKQEELIKNRIAEAEEKQRLAKKKEVHDTDLKKKWNNVIHEKTKRKERKGLSDEEIKRQLDEEDIVICDDVTPPKSSSSSLINQVVCPICNQSFHETDIENHASGCNQFEEIEETSSPVVGKRQRRNNKSDVLTCNVCKEFETSDTNEYVEHVDLCTEQYRSRRDDSGNQGDRHNHFSSERKNFNLRRRLN